jgi:hypothetical protein
MLGLPIRFRPVGLIFAIAVQLASAQVSTAPQPNITVHVIEQGTSKPLPNITITLRLGQYPGRKTSQQKTDSQGAAYFYLQPPLPDGVSADAFSTHYHEIQADPQITSLPQEVTIPVRRLSFMQSLHLIFAGD